VIAIGMADGSLSVFDGKERRWSITTRKDPKAAPDPYFAAEFNRDGKRLVAATASELHVIDANDGKVLARLPGVNGKFGVHPEGDGFVVSDGNMAKWFSPKSMKIERTMALPPGGVARLEVLNADHLLVASEDGSVRRLQYVKEGEKPKVIWEHRTPHRVPKFARWTTAADEYVIVYWGGLVEMLDASGTVRATRQFEQEITAMAPDQAGAILGFADGRVIGIR
jgi:hypothetical protein